MTRSPDWIRTPSRWTATAGPQRPGTRGVFADEVVPVAVPRRRGGEDIIEKDEGIRVDANLEAMATLRPAFRPDGTLTAGTSSPLSDGAAAVVITSRRTAERLGLTWLAEITAHATVAGPDSTLQHQPAHAIETACKTAGVQATELDLVEINEAFAAVGVASTRLLGVGPGEGQRRRRRDRAGSSAGHVGHPDHPAPGSRPRAARRRRGSGRAVRWRRAGAGGRADRPVEPLSPLPITPRTSDTGSGSTGLKRLANPDPMALGMPPDRPRVHSDAGVTPTSWRVTLGCAHHPSAPLRHRD